MKILRHCTIAFPPLLQAPQGDAFRASHFFLHPNISDGIQPKSITNGIQPNLTIISDGIQTDFTIISDGIQTDLTNISDGSQTKLTNISDGIQTKIYQIKFKAI